MTMDIFGRNSNGPITCKWQLCIRLTAANLMCFTVGCDCSGCLGTMCVISTQSAKMFIIFGKKKEGNNVTNIFWWLFLSRSLIAAVPLRPHSILMVVDGGSFRLSNMCNIIYINRPYITHDAASIWIDVILMSTDYTSSFRNDCYKFDTFEELWKRVFWNFHFRLIRDYTRFLVFH